MGFDSDTLFFAAGISATALALTMLSVWVQNRRDQFLIGWILGMALLGLGVVIYATVPPERKLVAALAFTLEITGLMAVYVGARLFTGKPVRWPVAFAASTFVALPIALLISNGMDGLGIAAYNIVAAIFLTMSALHYWQIREEAPFSVAGITTLYLLTAVSFVACGTLLLLNGEWALDGRPSNWAEYFNAVMAIIGITGIGALSLALNQSRVARRHRDEARTDALTGLQNRRALFNSLEANKLQIGDAVVVFDLDRFKSINDQYGHKAGDQILRKFANLLNKHAVQGDLAARVGGEEFVLVMRKATVALATARAEQIRASFATSPTQVGLEVIHATASAGIAFAAAPDDDFDVVLHRADTALYRSKSGGRDRVSTELQVVA